MRCDSAMAAIYDESGLEIENIEMLFTEEGMVTKVHVLLITIYCCHTTFSPGAYLFKAYSNGHPYDTSQVLNSVVKDFV